MKPYRKEFRLLEPSIYEELGACAKAITGSPGWERMTAYAPLKAIWGYRQEIIAGLLDVRDGVDALLSSYVLAAEGEQSDFMIREAATTVPSGEDGNAQEDEEEDAGEQPHSILRLEAVAERVALDLEAYRNKYMAGHGVDENEARLAEKARLQEAIFLCRPRDHILLGIAEQVSVKSIGAAAGNLKQTRDRLVTGSLGLAKTLAIQHAQRAIAPADLMQFAFMAVMDAIDRHDGRSEETFATLVAWRMVREVQRASRDNIAVPVKKHATRKLGSLREQEELFLLEKGRSPSVEELAERCGLPDQVIRELWCLAKGDVSLDAPLRTQAGRITEVTGRDQFPDQNPMDPVALIDRNRDIALLREALQSLPEIDRDILRARHELFGTEGKTQREIGKLMGGITGPAVGQREARAHRRLVEKIKALKSKGPPIE